MKDLRSTDIITLYNTLRMLRAVHADISQIEAEIKHRQAQIKTQPLDEFLAENERR